MRSRSQSPSKLNVLKNVSSTENSTQLDEAVIDVSMAYKGRLRERKPAKKLYFDIRDDSVIMDSDDEYFDLHKKGRKRRSKNTLKVR